MWNKCEASFRLPWQTKLSFKRLSKNTKNTCFTFISDGALNVIVYTQLYISHFRRKINILLSCRHKRNSSDAMGARAMESWRRSKGEQHFRTTCWLRKSYTASYNCLSRVLSSPLPKRRPRAKTGKEYEQCYRATCRASNFPFKVAICLQRVLRPPRARNLQNYLCHKKRKRRLLSPTRATNNRNLKRNAWRVAQKFNFSATCHISRDVYMYNFVRVVYVCTNWRKITSCNST